VFYITTSAGEKIDDPESLDHLRDQLQQVLDSLEDKQGAAEIFPEE
jgi:hypothetical protein